MTNTIIFQNPGLIDLKSFQVMGLSAKSTDNPIGMFGTGLKYAIAITLRLGGTFKIFRGEDEISFFTRKEFFRGQEFEFIYWRAPDQGEQPLGITTHFGFKWEPWMAIRELESNCRDENGGSHTGDYLLHPEGTTIVVRQADLYEAYLKLDEIFLDSKSKRFSNGKVEIHSNRGPNAASWMFYRGVRCAKPEKPSVFTWNIKSNVTLTEDRTFKYGFEVGTMIRSAIGYELDEPLMLEKILCAPEGTMEHDINYEELSVDPSEIFVETALAIPFGCNFSARKIARRARKLSEHVEFVPDEFQLAMVERARKLIAAMGEPGIMDLEINYAETVNGTWLGCVEHGKVWLSKRVFEQGQKQLTACLLEEYWHKTRGFLDKTYDFQNFLFDRIVGMAAQYITKEPI